MIIFYIWLCLTIFFLGPVMLMCIHSISTVLHSIGVMGISRKFCIELGYGKLKTFYVMLNAMYHDVGKLLIPAKILHKQGKLNKEERLIINTHSMNFLARFYGLFFPATIGHHINFNYDGYGMEVPQSKISAIIELCDVYDAIRGYFRTYSHPRSLVQTEEIMYEEINKFDPDLFVIFMKHIRAFYPTLVSADVDIFLRLNRDSEDTSEDTSKIKTTAEEK